MIVKIQVIDDTPEGDVIFQSFKGDELTSALSEAALYLQELAKKEAEF